MPWQRPGFELALLIEWRSETPRRRGIDPGEPWALHVGLDAARVLPEQHSHYRSDGRVLDEHRAGTGAASRVQHHSADPRAVRSATGASSRRRCFRYCVERVVESPGDRAFHGPDAAPPFAGSRWASALSRLGTSCPDHFLRTRICPFFIDWDSATGNVETLKAAIRMQVGDYRTEYSGITSRSRRLSTKLRDSNPSVVIIPGVGLASAGQEEARITTEFF